MLQKRILKLLIICLGIYFMHYCLKLVSIRWRYGHDVWVLARYFEGPLCRYAPHC